MPAESSDTVVGSVAFSFLFLLYEECIESSMSSVQTVQGDIHSLYKRSLQHKIKYYEL